MVAEKRSVCSEAPGGDCHHATWKAGQEPGAWGRKEGSGHRSPIALDPPLGPWPLALDPHMSHLLQLAAIGDRDLAALDGDQAAILELAHRA